MLRYKVVIGPTEEPVTLNELKEQIGIADHEADYDSLLTARITEAREWLEGHLSRKLISQTIEAVMDDFLIGPIECPTANVISVSSVKYYSPEGVDTTVLPSNYTTDNYGIRHWLIPALNYDWPETNCAANNVRIRWVVGYGAKEDVPAVIKEALKMIVGHWHHYQGSIESGITISRIPLAILDMVSHHRRASF